MPGIKISHFNPSRRFARVRKVPRHTPCGYCFEKWATCWDHIIPYNLGGPTDEPNLMPACRLCNGLLSDKVFDTLERKREYVRETLKKRRKRDPDLPTMREPIQEEASMATVLFTDVPLEELGHNQPEVEDRPTGAVARLKTKAGLYRLTRKAAS